MALLLVVNGPVLAQVRPALVEVDAVRVEPFGQTAPVLGRIVTRQHGPVAARVAGRVDKVAVDVGDRVEAGEPLVWLDSAMLGFERDLAEAEYGAAVAEEAVAVAQLRLLEGARDRLARLKGSAAFSEAQLIDKEHEIEVARSRINAATARIGEFHAKLQMRQQDLEDAVIRAPFSGVVTRRHVSPGAFVRVGEPVVTLIDDEQLEIEAEVSSDRLSGLDPGTEVRVRLDDGSRHSAVVRAVVPEENPLTRTRAVRFVPHFGATDKPLAVGQSVTIELPTGPPREVVTVDKDAVIQRPTGAMVFVVEDQAAKPRPVRLGDAIDSRFEVLDGLRPGELVVVRGNERLRPGQPVTYPGAPAPGAGGSEPES